MTEKLKPCPFCKGRARLIMNIPALHKKKPKQVFVRCDNCGVKTQTITQLPYLSWEAAKEYAVELWNRRAG